MMTRLQHLLTKLTEECAEVSQVALKTQQFGLDERYPLAELNNRQRCHAELNDLLAIVEMLNEEHDFGFTPDPVAIKAKKEKVNKYLLYSVDLGFVDLNS